MKYLFIVLLLTFTSVKSQNELTGIRLNDNKVVFEISNTNPFNFTIFVMNEPEIVKTIEVAGIRIPLGDVKLKIDEFNIENENRGVNNFFLTFDNVNYCNNFKVHLYCNENKIITTFKVTPIKKLGYFEFKIDKLTI